MESGSFQDFQYSASRPGTHEDRGMSLSGIGMAALACLLLGAGVVLARLIVAGMTARKETVDAERALQRTAEALRESEARYRSLTELASDWYWEQDETGSFTKVSGPVLEMLGIRVTTLAGGASDAGMTGWNEAEREALCSKISGRQPFLDFMLSRVNRDGSQQKFRVSGEPMFNQSCRFVGYRGIGVELFA